MHRRDQPFGQRVQAAELGIENTGAGGGKGGDTATSVCPSPLSLFGPLEH